MSLIPITVIGISSRQSGASSRLYSKQRPPGWRSPKSLFIRLRYRKSWLFLYVKKVNQSPRISGANNTGPETLLNDDLVVDLALAIGGMLLDMGT